MLTPTVRFRTIVVTFVAIALLSTWQSTMLGFSLASNVRGDISKGDPCWNLEVSVDHAAGNICCCVQNARMEGNAARRYWSTA